MKVGLVGVSYKTTPVEKREKLSIPESKKIEAIEYLKKHSKVDELILLSTCNRLEVYFSASNPLSEAENLWNALLQFQGLERGFCDSYRYFNREAVQHLFRVSSSLDSMIIGESQILGQVKEAYQLAQEAKSCDHALSRLMTKAFHTAKRVRHETKIASNAVSISYAAVELAKKIFEDLNDKVVLIIGAGEMAELVATHLMKMGCSHLMVANRTFAKAVDLAEKFKGSAVHFDSLDYHLEKAEIIISSTGAQGFVVSPKMVQKSLKKRKSNPMFFIDIAVPRDIDPQVNKIRNAYAYDIDDLQTVVDENLKERLVEAEKAEKIIDQELDHFESWFLSLKGVPTIKRFREHIQELANEELGKTMKKVQGLSPKEEELVRGMMHRFTNKILHTPTICIRQKSKEGGAELEHLELLHELFNLSPQTEEVEEGSPSNKVIYLK